MNIKYVFLYDEYKGIPQKLITIIPEFLSKYYNNLLGRYANNFKDSILSY